MGKIECMCNENVCIRSATKLMEQLNVHEKTDAAALDSCIRSIVAFGNDKVGMQLAAETEEQSILLYRPEPVDNSIRCIPVALKGHDVAAGVDADGRICLFAVKGDRLYRIREKAPYSGQFSNAEELPVTRPNLDSRIAGLTLHQLSDDSYNPFVLAVILSTADKKYSLALHYCNSSESRLFPVPVTTKCFTFSGDKRSELKLHVIKNNYGIYDVETGRAESSIPVNRSGGIAEAEAVKYIDGNTFVLYKDSGVMKISALTDSYDGSKKELSELFAAPDIHCFNAWGDKNSVSIAVHTDMICRGEAELSDGVWNAGSLSPLANSASMLSAVKYNGAMQLFYVTDKDNLLHRLEDMEGANWDETTYDTSGAESVTRQPCYSTELTFTDPKHKTVPLSGIEVTLTAESRTYVETAEGISMIDEKTSVTTVTDSQGKLFFRQYSSRLDVPTIYASVSGDLLGSDEQLSFSQFSDVYDRIGKVDGDTLLSAQQFDSKTSKYDPLISKDEYRTKGNADQLAMGIQKLVGSLNCANTGVMQLRKSNDLRQSAMFKNTDDLPSWRLQFMDDGSIVYEELTGLQAEKIISGFSGEDGLGLPKWLTKIGDFFRSVVKSIVRVCEVVVNGIKAMVRFVLNGVEMVFETVLNVVQDVLKFVEIIFAPVLVLFKDIFRWLASLFGWNYVLYTKKAISGMIELLLDWLPQNASELSSFMCGKIETAQKKVDEWIDEIIEKITPSGGVMSYFEGEIPDENEQYLYEISSDPIQAKFKEALASDTDADSIMLLLDDETTEFDDFFAELKGFINSLSDGGAFDEAMNYFKSAFDNMDNFFSFLLSGILSAIKALINLVLSGCAKIVSGLFDALSALLSKLRELVTAKISIPLLSEIYSWISDDDLTLLDLAALLAALPTTLIGKLVLGSAPFASEKDSVEFVERLRKSMKFTPSEPVSESAEVSEENLSDNDEFILKIVLTMSALHYGAVNFGLDAASIGGGDETSLGKAAAVISLLLEGTWLITSCPAFYDSSTSTEAQKGYSWAMWGVFIIGMGIDTAFFIIQKKHVDAEQTGRWFTTFYGAVHFLTALVGGSGQWLDACTTCGEVFCSVVEMSRCMLNFESLCKAALIIDACGMIAIAITNGLSFASNSEEETRFLVDNGNTQAITV
ncbi:MAG: hypothetical protein K2J11_06835 [Oscillospiraceae bacterium]|nr:hypothetical protein [Oscillospiraceae bacterium]